jgi:hypothetical protein
VNVYPFIEAERAEQRNVKRACALLEVSRAAFYDWARHVRTIASAATRSCWRRSRPFTRTARPPTFPPHPRRAQGSRRGLWAQPRCPPGAEKRHRRAGSQPL